MKTPSTTIVTACPAGTDASAMAPGRAIADRFPSIDRDRGAARRR